MAQEWVIIQHAAQTASPEYDQALYMLSRHAKARRKVRLIGLVGSNM